MDRGRSPNGTGDVLVRLKVLEEELQLLREKNLQLSQLLATSQQRHTEMEQRLLVHPVSGLSTHFQLGAVVDSLLLNNNQFSIVLLQLDSNYDMIKRTMKSSVSEWVLYQLAQRLSNLLTTTDYIFHTRENEFLILKRNDIGTDLNPFLNQVLQQMSEPHIFMGFNLTIGCRMGVSHFPQHGIERSQLLHKADIALGRSQELRLPYIVFEPSLEEIVLEKMELQNAIIKAIEAPALKAIGNQFELYFQPKLTLTTQDSKLVVTEIQAEVLLRWNHPTRGQVSPAQFIPIAEETGLIMPIGKWSFFQVTRRLQAWQRNSLRDVRLAFNVSARQFRSPELLEILQRTIEKNNFFTDKLTLEVTETSLFEDPILAQEILKEFKNLGLKISVDDFGTGYSSLSHLHRFPLDEIKIDQSFIKNFPSDPQDLAIVRSLISIAQELGLNIVAEGVEREEQLTELLRLGCPTIQGFLIAKPLPLGSFEKFVHQIQANHYSLVLA